MIDDESKKRVIVIATMTKIDHGTEEERHFDDCADDDDEGAFTAV